MPSKNTQPMKDQRQILSAVDVDALIDELHANKSPKKLSTQPEVQATMRLHALTSDDTIDPQFALSLKQDILQATQADSTAIVKKEKRRDLWKMLLLPIAPISVTAAAVIVSIQLNQSETPDTEIAQQRTVEEEPSQLLGAPVRDEHVERPEGGYTIDYVEFQRRLNERSSSGDLINLGEGNPPSRGTGVVDRQEQKDEAAENGNTHYLYSQLRLDAYRTLATDADIAELLQQGGLDITNIISHMEEFKKTINTWPTDEQPFDNNAYADAVDDLVQHNKGWNRLMNEVTDELVRDYQERHPEWQPGQPITE